jgi:glutamate racemase
MVGPKAKKITVRFSKSLKAEMQHAIIKLGYGLHGKSRWLTDAVVNFLKQPNYIELVEHGINMNQADLCDVEAFYLHERIVNEVKQALIQVRTHFPMLEGVQSAFIRSCVIYQLVFS